MNGFVDKREIWHKYTERYISQIRKFQGNNSQRTPKEENKNSVICFNRFIVYDYVEIVSVIINVSLSSSVERISMLAGSQWIKMNSSPGKVILSPIRSSSLANAPERNLSLIHVPRPERVWMLYV